MRTRRTKRQEAGCFDTVLRCPSLELIFPNAVVAASTWLKLSVVLIQGEGLAGI